MMRIWPYVLAWAAFTKSQTLGGLNSRDFIFHSLEVGSLGSGYMPVRALLLVWRRQPSCCALLWPLHGLRVRVRVRVCVSVCVCVEREREDHQSCHIMSLSLQLNLNYLLKAVSPNTITLEVRASIYEFRRGCYSVHGTLINTHLLDWTATKGGTLHITITTRPIMCLAHSKHSINISKISQIFYLWNRGPASSLFILVVV